MNSKSDSPQGSSEHSSLTGAAGSARIRLHQPLPSVCALCGAPAVKTQRMSFLGVLGELFELFFRWTSEGAPVMLPLCHTHRHFRKWWPSGGRALYGLAIVICLLALLQATRLSILLGAVLILLDFVLLAWLATLSLRIRASRRDSKHVVLVGLAPEFVRACEEMDRLDAERVADSINVIEFPNAE